MARPPTGQRDLHPSGTAEGRGGVAFPGGPPPPPRTSLLPRKSPPPPRAHPPAPPGGPRPPPAPPRAPPRGGGTTPGSHHRPPGGFRLLQFKARGAPAPRRLGCPEGPAEPPGLGRLPRRAESGLEQPRLGVDPFPAGI